MEPTGPIASRSLQEEVYKRLRQLIFNREIDAEPLKIRQLADRFGVSSMPVREALRRLEADGLVTFTRNKSIVISKLSPKEVRDIFEVRLRLEPFAGRRATDRLTTNNLEELGLLHGKLNDFSDGDKWRANNAEFHRIIIVACGIPRLASIIDNLWLAVEPYRRYYINNLQFLETAQAQHGQIVKALRKKDGPGVEKILDQHLSSTLDTILQGMGRDVSAVEGGS